MSFFKDFKDDLSQAVDDLIPSAEREAPAPAPQPVRPEPRSEAPMSDLDALLEKVSPDRGAEERNARAKSNFFQSISGDQGAPQPMEGPAPNPYLQQQAQQPMMNSGMMAGSDLPATDEVTIITAGTLIHGDIESTGSLEISGEIEGNVACRGKLTVTGTVTGNSTAEEVFADSARITGEINSNGTVKIGLGSVIIGNVAANSAVIAGAIKGDIDVHGPVVVDTSAVVMGNIKSRSVQINNGAVIDGYCSQSYAEIDVDSLFGGKARG